MRFHNDAQRRAMFANMKSIGYRDNEFAFNFGGIFKAGVPTLNIGLDLIGDVFHGVPVIFDRSPLESEILGDRYRIRPLLAEDIWRSKVGDIFY